MITIELNENSAKDFKTIQKMRKEGIPEDFIQTVYPEQGRADAFARQQAVANLKEKIDNYLKQ